MNGDCIKKQIDKEAVLEMEGWSACAGARAGECEMWDCF